MKKIAAIGELLIDFVPQEKGCALSDVVHFERVAGGAPANVVTAVSRLGGNGVMVSQVGCDAFGTHIIRELEKSGVDTRYVFRTRQANTGLAFVSLAADGNREFSFFRNPSADLYLSEEQMEPGMLEDTAVLHFCSVDLVDWPVRKAHERLIALAKERGVIISFDPNVRLPLWETPEACQQAIREFLPLADIIKLSDEELEFVTGCEDEAEAAKKLLESNCRMLILTKGADGSSVYTRQAEAHISAVSVDDVVDTTGAGDSFAGSFLFQLVQKQVSLDGLDALTAEELQQLLTFSANYAALTIRKKGAVMATMQEMEEAYS
ncbi:MAG: carbohydrate kinase [Clostridiales bacterium]|nr:carbohydrate kinase [Clostridiales bacterium]